MMLRTPVGKGLQKEGLTIGENTFGKVGSCELTCTYTPYLVGKHGGFAVSTR